MGLEIKTKKKDGEGEKDLELKHKNAIAFVERNRDLFQLWAGKYGVRIEPAPKGLNTFAYDLENRIIYVNDIFYKEGLGNSERLIANEKSTFAVEHEIEHMLEHMNILKESETDNLWKIKGKEVWQEYLNSLESDDAFAILDNCVSDIRQNRSVIEKSNKGKREIEKKIYKENCFPSEDLRSGKDEFGVSHPTPKHIQFSEALLVEARSRDCIVDEEVREAIDKLKKVKNEKTGKNIIQAITDPNIPMSNRLYWQDKVIKPIMKELRKKDFEDKQNQDNNSNNSNSNQGQGKKNNKKSAAEEAFKKIFKKDKNKKGDNKGESGEEKNKEEPTTEDYNKAFAEDYKRAKDKLLPKGDVKEIEKAVKEYLEEHPELGETKEEKEDRQKKEIEEKKAKDLGVKVNDLRNYNSLSKRLRESKEFERLNDLIKKIVSERKRERYTPHYPVEEGDELMDPAGLVSSVKGGNLRPKVWQDTETKEYKGELFSEIEMTLVFDRSGSMEGKKLQEVQKAVVLFMNSQKDLQEEINQGENEDNGLIKGLKVSWEVYSFQNTNQDFIPVKSMSSEFSEKDRINVCSHFNEAPGSRTTDANCLSAIYNDLNNNSERKEKIKENELKKIVIVMTDGESHQFGEVKNILKKLKDLDVSVIGIGITNEGKSVLTTYGSDSRVAEKAEDVARELEYIIENQFKDLLPLRN